MKYTIQKESDPPIVFTVLDETKPFVVHLTTTGLTFEESKLYGKGFKDAVYAMLAFAMIVALITIIFHH